MRRSSSGVLVCAFLLVGLVIGTAPALGASMFAPVLGSPFSTGQQPSSVAFSPDGKLLATADAGANKVSVFSVASGGALSEVSGSPYPTGQQPSSVAFSPDGKLLATADAGANKVSVFSVASGGALSEVSGSPYPTGQQPSSVAFSPDGKLLATADAGANKVSVFSVASGGALSEVSGSPYPTGQQPSSVAFSPDGKLLATADAGANKVSVFSVASGGALSEVSGSPYPTGQQPSSVAFSPDGKLLATADAGANKVSVFSVASGGALSEVSGSPYPTGQQPSSVAFSSSGLLASANAEDNTVSVFSVASGGALSEVSGSPYPTGQQPSSVAFSSSGLLASANAEDNTVSVFFHDTTPPVITGTGDLTAEATSASGAVVSYEVHATDPDSPPTVVCDHPSGSTFPLGATLVHCTASDPSGNSASTSFRVTVRDTTAPTITLPGTVTREATSSQGAIVDYTVSASDLVDGPLSVTCTPQSGSTFTIGTTTVSCNATDKAGNVGHGSFDVVVAHTAGPVITLPGTITAQATGPSGAQVRYTASAYDAVDGPATASCTPASGSMFRLGTTTVSCRAADRSGNMGYGSFEIRVADAIGPVITLPRPITAEATGPTGAKVQYTAAARDTVDGPVTPSCSPAPGSMFKLGATTVSCTATDRAGNTTAGAFQVLVRDTIPPTLKLPAGMIIGARGPQDAIIFYSAIASDLVDGTIAPSCNPAPGSQFALGTTSVRCSASDKSRNTSRGSFTVTVKATAPWLTNVSQTHESWVSGKALPQYAKARPPIGTTFTYTLNQPAQVTFAFATTTTGHLIAGKCVPATTQNRGKPPCQRTVTATLRHQAHSGPNALHFDGRLTPTRWLPPATYTVKITATANSHRSYVRILQFTIIR